MSITNTTNSSTVVEGLCGVLHQLNSFSTAAQQYEHETPAFEKAATDV